MIHIVLCGTRSSKESTTNYSLDVLKIKDQMMLTKAE